MAKRAGEGDEGVISVRFFKIIRINGDGFHPTDTDTDDREEDSTDGVDMRDRIYGHTSFIFSSIVTKLVSDKGMGKFMDGTCGNKDEEFQSKLIDIHSIPILWYFDGYSFELL